MREGRQKENIASAIPSLLLVDCRRKDRTRLIRRGATERIAGIEAATVRSIVDERICSTDKAKE